MSLINDRNDRLHASVTRAIWQAEEATRIAELAWLKVASIEHMLVNSLPTGPEKRIAKRGTFFAKRKARTLAKMIPE